MFNFCSKKDEEIAQLKKRISELESEKSSEDVLLDELNEVVLKFEKGFFGITVENTSLNQKLNSIKDNFNKALINNARLADAGIKTLIEYGNARFDYKLEADNLSGKVGSIILGIEALGGTISEILSLLDTSSQELHEQVVELSSAANNLAVASNQQAASLEETAAALEEVSSTIANTNENTIKMAQLSNEVNISAKSGQKLANDTADSMIKINEEVTLIQNATAIIDQIAFQTNILSLNAAVEAATAGEAGKGFAVVAAEVRNLASRSAEAAKEINSIVQKAKARAAEGREIASSMISGYEILNQNISNQITIIQEVSSASKEQRSAIEQINNAVNELDKTTQQNAAAATQISSQTNEIESLSMKLIDVVNHTSYSKDAATRVCDIDMMFVINRLKLDHINFKDINCNKLNSKKSWTVTNEKECNLGKWIVEQENNNKAFTKTKNWEYLKEQHQKVHGGVQIAVNANASGDLNTMRNISTEIDKAINGVFKGMQKTKEENCSL